VPDSAVATPSAVLISFSSHTGRSTLLCHPHGRDPAKPRLAACNQHAFPRIDTSHRTRTCSLIRLRAQSSIQVVTTSVRNDTRDGGTDEQTMMQTAMECRMQSVNGMKCECDCDAIFDSECRRQAARCALRECSFERRQFSKFVGVRSFVRSFVHWFDRSL